ncbi:MAG: FAD-dependent oxidoreductase [Candidatus Hadarchaeales archaeon]
MGSQSAGFTAASYAKVLNRGAEVTLIEKRPYGLYHPCGIPLAIRGDVDFKDLLHRSAPPGVKLICGTEAVEIDQESKKLRLREVSSGKESLISYDSLVVATGGKPVRPDIPGIDLNGVYTLRTVEDGEAILRRLHLVKCAAVVGGGPVGVEVSFSLAKRGARVTVVEQMPHLLPSMLDPDMSDQIAKKLESEGIQVICGEAVSELVGKKEVTGVIAGRDEQPASLVVVAAGVKPEVSVAECSGIKVGRTGGIQVDDRMRTSAEDVFAAGECAETKNMITNKPVVSFLASTAMAMGRAAGINAAGGNAKFRGVLGSTVVSVGDLTAGATGLNLQSAEQAGFKVVSARVRVLDRPIYSGGEHLLVKLLADSGSGKIVGGQIIGRNGVAEMVDLLSFAISSGAAVEDLRDYEHCYMPSISDLIGPLQVAADALIRKMG